MYSVPQSKTIVKSKLKLYQWPLFTVNGYINNYFLFFFTSIILPPFNKIIYFSLKKSCFIFHSLNRTLNAETAFLIYFMVMIRHANSKQTSCFNTTQPFFPCQSIAEHIPHINMLFNRGIADLSYNINWVKRMNVNAQW